MRHSYATNEPFLYFYVYVKMMFWFDIDHVIQHSLPCKLLYHIVYIILSCPSLPFVKLYCILFYKTFDEQSISKKWVYLPLIYHFLVPYSVWLWTCHWFSFLLVEAVIRVQLQALWNLPQIHQTVLGHPPACEECRLYYGLCSKNF